MASWLEKNILLDRPEYVKQPEGILTDLLWRSHGSSLGAQNELSNLHSLALQGQPMERLVFQSITGKMLPFETRGLLEKTSQASLFNNNTGENPFLPIIGSLAAPRARGSKSGACVPIDPNLVLLQTLHGLANKKAPPNMAEVVETAAWHGGASGDGDAAYSFLLPFEHGVQATGGLSRLLTLVAPLFADTAWQAYPVASDSPPMTWPKTPLLNPHTPSARPYKSLLSPHPTPYRWFWKYWTRLCDVHARWFDVLPSRRWIDWALCLLRTSLALSYVWEAQLLYRMESAAREHAAGPRGPSWSSLTGLLSGDYVLARFEDPSLPANQKNCAQGIRQVLQDGQAARELLKDEFNTAIQTNVVQSSDFLGEIDNWLNTAGKPGSGKPNLGPRDAFQLPKNTYEFIRYTLLQRPSDDDTWDQADFYYLARADKSRKYLWFEPGPEWLVVAVSLCAGKPHGTCTLRELRNDLRLLGISVERGILVKMLENYGLSTDSPDADDALVIQSGF